MSGWKRRKVADLFSNFYRNLFVVGRVSDVEKVLEVVPEVVTDVDNMALLSPISDAEIKRAAFELGKMKAPGLNGFSGVFYQFAWYSVGTEVICMVKEFFEHGSDLGRLNETRIVLDPKVKKLEGWVNLGL